MGKTIHFTGTGKKREYNFNDTKYIVETRFAPIGEGDFLRNSIEKLLEMDFAHWTDDADLTTIDSNEMHFLSGKEDYEDK